MKIKDSSEGDDSKRKDLFDNFFSLELPVEIDKEEFDKNITGIKLVDKENSHYLNKETNDKWLNNTVTTITTVINGFCIFFSLYLNATITNNYNY